MRSRTHYAGDPSAPARFSFPQPGLGDFDNLLTTLASAGERLARTPLSEIVEALSAAARTFAGEGTARRQAALDLLEAVTGRARAMCADSLDFLLWKLTSEQLLETARAATLDPATLEGFSPRTGSRRRRAVGPRLTLHVLAGNTPWAGVESVVAASLARSASLVKLSSREPVLTGLFAQAAAESDETLSDALAVLHWTGGERSLEEAALAAADCVVAFGDNSTVSALGERLAWQVAAGRTRFVSRGHRVSVALVGAEALRSESTSRATAQALAFDFALEDQEGCLSPHGAYLEARATAAEIEAFAAHLAQALEERERAWPRRIPAEAAAAAHQARGAAELAGARVLAPEGSTRWTVVVDPRPLFEPSPQARYAWLKPVDALDAAIEALAPARGLLSTIGIAGFGTRAAEIVERLAALAPGRICPLGRMQRPAAGWNHDGISDLAALLSWVEAEDL